MGNALGDTGTTQIDSSLLHALTISGVKDADARELSRMDAFGGCPVAGWMAGLRGAAILFGGGTISLDWGTSPNPWHNIGPRMMANGKGPAEAFVDSTQGLNQSVRDALLNAIGAVITHLAEDAGKIRPINIKSRLAPRQVADSEQAIQLLKPIDEQLVKVIRKILAGEVSSKKYKQAGEQLLEWLSKNGKFIRTVYGHKYYLYNPTHKLFTLDTNSWHGWLYLLTGVNPAAGAFRYFLADCNTAAEYFGEALEVVKVAHWDEVQKVLRVSRFDGWVYRLDGMTIEEEANGDGPVLFDDAMYWTSYKPDYSAKGEVLRWSLQDIPNWDGHKEECDLIYNNWWMATFFTELCPTRPIMVLKGEKGSGKTMALRIILRFMFGPAVDVVGIPDKADAFTTLTSNAHIVALDNMDEFAKELRDKIASLSTGKLDEIRKLYTTNEQYIIRYRCWLAVTSRTPDTLQRDDLVDRIIILPVKQLNQNGRIRESSFLTEVVLKRNQWWGDTLLTLNSIIAEIRRNGIPERGGLRMEDWAAFGTMVARIHGQEDIWESGLKVIRSKQSDFLLEDDVVFAALRAWLFGQTYTPNPQRTRQLYGELKSSLFGASRPDSDWPQSVKSFGRRLKGMERELTEYLFKANINMYSRETHGERMYEFVKFTGGY